MPNQRSWSDDQLRAAVAASTTYTDVLRKLGLSLRGRNHDRIQDHIERLDLDTSHFSFSPRPFTDDQLRAVVPSCTSLIMVVEVLGLERTNTNAKRVQRRIGILGITTQHFLRRPHAGRRPARWSDDDLRRAVASAYGYAAVLRALGLVAAGGNYDVLRKRIRALGLDTSHFRGQGWNVGMRFQPSPARPLEEVLVADSWTASHHLKNRLIRAGLKAAACELCNWAARAPDGRVPVELDHINGDKSDNRIENLRILCPNCHALQPTHRGLNQKRRKR